MAGGCHDFAGQHKGLLQTAMPGLERVKRGHDLAFLASMPWNTIHLDTVLLADCESSVEAATLSIALPSADLFCLRSVGDRSLRARGSADEEQGAKASMSDWHEQVMHVKVAKGQSVDALHAIDTHEWEFLYIHLKHAGLYSIPQAFDIVVIPAEGREHLLSSEPSLLHSSQVVVSEDVIEHSHIWDMSSQQQHELSESSLNLHLHKSGWEVYAKHSLFSSNDLEVKAGSARGQVKVALHITATSHYQLSIQQHFSRLIFSGLYDIAAGIYCFILGPDDAEIEVAASFVQRFGRKVIVAGKSTEMSRYERFTLLGIRAHLNPEDYLLYLHTKGISRDPTSLPLFDWVFYMHYFVVKQFPVCLSLLKEHFDTCGVDYHFPGPSMPWVPAEHYSGNFWWARASYYLSLPDSIGAGYFDPEMYIGLGTPKYIALWRSNTNMYATKYPPLEFVDTAATAIGRSNRSAPGAIA